MGSGPRRRAAVELTILAVGASLFIALVPDRPMLVDLGLAALGLVFIALGSGWTRRTVWGPGPPAAVGRRATLILAAATLAALPLIAAAGRPRLSLSLFATLLAFAAWAWLQQVMFQFYLLGRLRLLLPGLGTVALSGLDAIVFAVVHAPQWDLVVVTAPAGWLWSVYYVSTRRLLPIALSQALLGTAYFYWLRGEDLITRWLAIVP